MRGEKTCPVTKRDCTKADCEWWDEYELECAVNLLVRYVRKIDGNRSE